MAEYYTRFCCRLPVGTAENALHALVLYEAMAGTAYMEDDGAVGFEVVADRTDPGTLVIHDGNGFGEPEGVATFALRCAEAFGLQGRWGFPWAHACSKARLDGFGGGALVLDLDAREVIARIDCGQWLAGQLAIDGACPPCPGAALAEAIAAVLLAIPDADRGRILREAGCKTGWHVLALLDEAGVREEVRELVQTCGESVAVPAADVGAAEIHEACRRAVDHTDLSEEIGAARFQAAAAAIRAAEARRARAMAPAPG